MLTRTEFLKKVKSHKSEFWHQGQNIRWTPLDPEIPGNESKERIAIRELIRAAYVKTLDMKQGSYPYHDITLLEIPIDSKGFAKATKGKHKVITLETNDGWIQVGVGEPFMGATQCIVNLYFYGSAKEQ